MGPFSKLLLLMADLDVWIKTLLKLNDLYGISNREGGGWWVVVNLWSDLC